MTVPVDSRELAKCLVQRLASVSLQERLIVGISGIPGAGKSTLAQHIIEHTNELLTETDDRAIIVGLDGWHLTRAQLDVFPDPKLAHDRRGAHWTFDGHGYAQFVASLKNRDTEAALSAPTFDHALKDPTPQGVTIHSFHRIVVVEGIYAFLSIEPWLAASRLLDERWWLDIDENEARRRLAKRHVVSGITKDEEAGLYRADHNDLPNGRFVRENMLEPTKYITYQADGSLLLTGSRVST